MTTDPWSDWPDRWPDPPPPRPAKPQQVSCWVSRHVVSYTANDTPVYAGVAITDTRRRVIAWSIGAEVEIVCDA